uniref:Calcium voltage-gated channel auxiliary subunit alpha2delta 3 n=1 Tax=Catharus ustulatus TaxID=91951 RepID=A0A8C3VHI7_CATUS
FLLLFWLLFSLGKSNLNIVKGITFPYFFFFFQKYKEYEKDVAIEEIDGLQLVKKLAKNMEEMFHKKSEAVRRLVEAAEDAYLKHEFDADLQYEYFNAVLINERDEEGNYLELGKEFILVPNDHFNNLPVNISLSDVQVPTNMYNKDPAIVNGVYWSESLNKVFVDNFDRDPSLIWQYFGSAKGFFRQYPGIKWEPDENGVIAFDCRNRKWYIQAATSPKDVVILVDVSGSMKGLRLTIAKQTVSSILDTLGDDDFFNIIAYNEELHYVEPCLNGTLVQADRANKEHFREHLDKLFAKGIGMLDIALNEAFNMLNEFNHTGQGSICSQAIMLITDGAVDTYDTIFAKYNWPDRKVRIFTYLIGREAAFADNLKWMACANKGFFTQISTLADVQENVMEYLHVLSRPKVIDQEHDVVWTEAYIDSTLADDQGLVLMTTVAMPVFSKQNETRSKGILLGVVGTDVPVKELLKTIPKYKYEEGKKRRKPNYSSVDLSEVEWEDRDDVVSDVCFISLHSLGVALSRGHGKYFFRGNVTVEEGKVPIFSCGLHSSFIVNLVGPCLSYCNTDLHPEHRQMTQLEAIKRYLTGKEPLLQCDKELIQEVLFDAVVSAPIEAYWTSLALNKSENSDKGVEVAFLGTRTGLSRINLFVGPEQDFLTAEDKENIFNADHFPLWYRRAAEQIPGSFVYSIPFSTGNLTGWQKLSNISVLSELCNAASHVVHNFVCCSSHVHIKMFFPVPIAQRLKQTLEPCDTEYPAFVSERTIKETTGNIACDDCFKSFVIQQIPSSNLFMVVVDNECFSSLLNCLAHNESLKCERLKSQKIRRRPESCHGFHPEENARECGGVSGLSAKPSLVLLPLLLMIFSR